MAKWTITNDGYRYSGGADNSADQVDYGFRFDLVGPSGEAKANVEVCWSAPRRPRSARHGRNWSAISTASSHRRGLHAAAKATGRPRSNSGSRPEPLRPLSPNSGRVPSRGSRRPHRVPRPEFHATRPGRRDGFAAYSHAGRDRPRARALRAALPAAARVVGDAGRAGCRLHRSAASTATRSRRV